MANLKYDFLSNEYSEPPFTTFKVASTPKITYPLGDFDLPYGFSGVTSDGKLVAENVFNQEANKENSWFNINNSEEIPIVPYLPTEEKKSPSIQPSSKKIYITKSKESDSLSKLIDEVSKEKGYEGLKDQETKNLIMLQAQRESNYNPKIKSNSSSASGYFQFIDSTRKQFSDYSKEDFINNPKEQVRAAYKYLKYILSMPNAQKLKTLGYNNALITALGWWYPDSMRMILNGNKDFSLGGYSIKKAFEDYG